MTEDDTWLHAGLEHVALQPASVQGPLSGKALQSLAIQAFCRLSAQFILSLLQR